MRRTKREVLARGEDFASVARVGTSLSHCLSIARNSRKEWPIYLLILIGATSLLEAAHHLSNHIQLENASATEERITARKAARSQHAQC